MQQIREPERIQRLSEPEPEPGIQQETGREWSCECHCGYEPSNGFEWSWSSKCEDQCSGDSNQSCGGSNALSLWTTPPKHPSGLCINDYPESQRILNEYSVTGLDNMTIEYCAAICDGK